MTEQIALSLAANAMATAAKLAAPIVLSAMAVGLLVSIFQSVTQIQEMTLTFVPKMLVILLSLMIFMPFMLATLTSFTQSLMGRIISG